MRGRLGISLVLVVIVLIAFSLLALYRLKNPDILSVSCKGIRHVAFKNVFANPSYFHPPEQHTFEGQVVLSDYRALFGVSLTLIDNSSLKTDPPSYRKLPERIEFSRQECTLFEDGEVACSSNFGGIPQRLTVKPKQGVAVGRTETVAGDRILYTLQCGLLR